MTSPRPIILAHISPLLIFWSQENGLDPKLRENPARISTESCHEVLFIFCDQVNIAEFHNEGGNFKEDDAVQRNFCVVRSHIWVEKTQKRSTSKGVVENTRENPTQTIQRRWNKIDQVIHGCFVGGVCFVETTTRGTRGSERAVIWD